MSREDGEQLLRTGDVLGQGAHGSLAWPWCGAGKGGLTGASPARSEIRDHFGLSEENGNPESVRLVVRSVPRAGARRVDRALKVFFGKSFGESRADDASSFVRIELPGLEAGTSVVVAVIGDYGVCLLASTVPSPAHVFTL